MSEYIIENMDTILLYSEIHSKLSGLLTNWWSRAVNPLWSFLHVTKQQKKIPLAVYVYTSLLLLKVFTKAAVWIYRFQVDSCSVVTSIVDSVTVCRLSLRPVMHSKQWATRPARATVVFIRSEWKVLVLVLFLPIMPKIKSNLIMKSNVMLNKSSYIWWKNHHYRTAVSLICL